MWPFSKRSDPPATQTPIQTLINTIAGYISPLARQERTQKLIGNPAEREIETQRIRREAAHYLQGFPVAGHGEREPKHSPRQRMRL